MNSLQRKGKTYENKAARQIRDEYQKLIERKSFSHPPRRGLVFYSGQWITFCDSKGNGYAQPDLFLHLSNKIILFEFKLSRSAAAEKQLKALYAPLLWHIFSVPITCVSTFHNPGPGFQDTDLVILSEVLKLPDWTYNEWHLPI